MAKKETVKKAEKQGFAWDSEKKIGEYGDAKLKTEVRLCTLNGTDYLSATNYVMSSKTQDWKRTKTRTMPVNMMKECLRLFEDSKLEEAFGSTEELQAPSKLKASQKAKGSREALKGKKLSVEERLATNENFTRLKGALQGDLIGHVYQELEDTGMVGVIISKTSWTSVSGRGRDDSEKLLKGIKGFTKGAFTYITE